MGEIKSTLDIVMEKTKHLSMSSEEKLEKEKEDIRLSIKGLVQKYHDQILSLEMFRKELGVLHQQYTFDDKEVLLNEIFSRFDLESDNSFFLKLLKDTIYIDCTKLEEMLNQYKDKTKKLADNRVGEIRKELKEKYSVSGSAIVPNIYADSSWQTMLNDMKSLFHSKLDEIKSGLLHQ